MSRSNTLIAAAAVLTLALAPSIAMAKAGGGFSFGSRGARTYSAPPMTQTAPSPAVPMDRSFAPRAAPSAPFGGAAPFAQPRRSGFMSGLAGGLLGVGIGSLLFGGGLFGGSGFGFFSLIGLLLQGALLYFVARWLFRTFMRQPAMAGSRPYARPAPMQAAAPLAGGAGLSINKADYTAFEQLLQSVQTAWSNADTRALSAITTPEMTGYFAEQLADQASRGVRNSVTHVKLDKGDLAEAWTEGNRDYATVAMQFSALDVTKDAAGRIVEGDIALRTITTELWTFMRVQGGQWLLSALQQVR